MTLSLNEHTLKFECTHCGRVHEIKVPESRQVHKGDIITPYPGGGNYGRCHFCRRPGLRAIEERVTPKRGPVGWRNIPKK